MLRFGRSNWEIRLQYVTVAVFRFPLRTFLIHGFSVTNLHKDFLWSLIHFQAERRLWNLKILFFDFLIEIATRPMRELFFCFRNDVISITSQKTWKCVSFWFWLEISKGKKGRMGCVHHIRKRRARIPRQQPYWKLRSNIIINRPLKG